MTRVLNKAKKALQEMHREYLQWAMSWEDIEYVETMNAMFRLIERLEDVHPE